MKHHIVIRIILVLIPIIVLGCFTYQYINPSGELIVKYDFCQKETSYFSGLSPYGRVLNLEKSENNCFQKMIIDPVYFDVRLPQTYREVSVESVYKQKKYDDIFQVGVSTDPGNWQWNFGTQQTVFGEYKIYKTVNLSLSNAVFSDNRYRFIISAPGLDESSGEVEFHKINLIFKKPALTSHNLLQRLKSFINL